MTLTLAAYEPQGWQNTGGVDSLAFTPHGSTFGKVQGSSGKDPVTRTVTIGNEQRPVIDEGLHIPISATVPEGGLQRGLGWEYEVTAVGLHDDPALLGRRYLVVNSPAKSFATARRLDVVEVPQ